MNVAIVCTGLLAILLFGLGLYVSIQRQRSGWITETNYSPAPPARQSSG